MVFLCLVCCPSLLLLFLNDFQYVYMHSNNPNTDPILNKTIFWLGCLHGLLVEYSCHIHVYMVQRASLIKHGWLTRCGWSFTDFPQEFDVRPHYIHFKEEGPPGVTDLLSCCCCGKPFWVFSSQICCVGRLALLIDYDRFSIFIPQHFRCQNIQLVNATVCIYYKLRVWVYCFMWKSPVCHVQFLLGFRPIYSFISERERKRGLLGELD